MKSPSVSAPRRTVIVLTGSPGGGKTTLLKELDHDPRFAGRFVSLPEAIKYAHFLHIPNTEPLFQRVMVYLQMSLEDALDRALGSEDNRPILCHRGSLDPLAYWMRRGWNSEAFFDYTATTCDIHYRRYTAVIHLVTTADGAPRAYQRWPQAHRPETPEEAIQIDRLLQQAWGDHTHYVRIHNQNRDWEAKSEETKERLLQLLVVG